MRFVKPGKLISIVLSNATAILAVRPRERECTGLVMRRFMSAIPHPLCRSMPLAQMGNDTMWAENTGAWKFQPAEENARRNYSIHLLPLLSAKNKLSLYNRVEESVWYKIRNAETQVKLRLTVFFGYIFWIKLRTFENYLAVQFSINSKLIFSAKFSETLF